MCAKELRHIVVIDSIQRADNLSTIQPHLVPFYCDIASFLNYMDEASSLTLKIILVTGDLYIQ